MKMSSTRTYVGLYGNLILMNVVEGFVVQIMFFLLVVAHLWMLHKSEEE